MQTTQATKVLSLCGLVCAFAYGYLALHSQSYADAQLQHLFISSSIAFSFSVLAWFYCWRNGYEPSPALIIVFALLFRAIGFAAFPVLEDDIYRYLWDGRMTILDGTPYNHIPADFFALESISAKFDAILGRINYPDIATVYGPSLQWLFAASYLIAPGELWPLKLFIIGADLVIILLLLRLAPASYVLLYAWSPLVIKEFAFTAHPDVIGALFLLGAFIARQRNYLITTGILLALAAGTKIFAIIAAPLLLSPSIKTLRKITVPWRGWFAFGLTAFALSLPWGFVTAWLPSGLKAMGSDWLFNAPLYILNLHWLNIDIIKLILLAVFLAVAARFYWQKTTSTQDQTIQQQAHVIAALFGVLLICSPALNPWYLIWVLPFGVLAPRVWIWVSSAVILLAYASGINLANSALQAYEHPQWVLMVEVLCIGLALVYDYVYRKPSSTMVD